MIQIYHNRDAESQEIVCLLDDVQKNQIIKYLDNPPTYEDLCTFKTKFKPIALVVRQKKRFGLKIIKINLLSEEIIKTMVLYPILIERPIVIKGDKAMIARDLDRLLILK
jgi:arsenate reductase